MNLSRGALVQALKSVSPLRNAHFQTPKAGEAVSISGSVRKKRLLSSRVESGNGKPQESSTSAPGSDEKSTLSWKRIFRGLAFGSVLGGFAYASTRDPGTISQWSFKLFDTLTPLLRILDPETAHDFGMLFAKYSILPQETRPDPESLNTKLWGLEFSNPIGLAAGFDKHAEAIDGLSGLGFGFIEIGSVTPAPQDGNPKPRIFRIRERKALINRCGFNSHGIVEVAARLGSQHSKRQWETQRGHGANPNLGPGTGLLGVNLGKNKESEDAAGDYLLGIHSLAQYADYLVINVSSPNTPGLRALQGRKKLSELIKKLLAARDNMQWGPQGPPPLLVKIAPDLSHQDLLDIATVVLALKIDGLIVSNTTTSRPDSVLGYVHAHENGGLSGKPLLELSNHALTQMYRLTKGKIPLIGCGGVSSGEDAYRKIRAGASLVQIWTSLAYEGPGVVPKIKKELAALLRRDGYSSVAEAVGADHRQSQQSQSYSHST